MEPSSRIKIKGQEYPDVEISRPFKSPVSQIGEKGLSQQLVSSKKLKDFSVKTIFKGIKRAISHVFEASVRGYVFMGHRYQQTEQKAVRKFAVVQQEAEKMGFTEMIEKLKKPTKSSDAVALKEFTEKNRAFLTQYAKLESKLEFVKKREKGRAEMSLRGGERVSITTEDKVKLDGMFFDARNYRKRLSDNGVKLGRFEVTDTSGKTKALQGLVLTEGHFLDSKEKQWGNWVGVTTGNDQVLFREEDVKDESVFRKDEQGRYFWKKEVRESIKSDIQNIDVDAKASGTVILTLGAPGTYENSTGEELFYLLRNMNVMMYNFRGYGESEGVPSIKGLNKDMEAAFQMAKDKSGHSDEHILFKALCMSGGPAAYVASNHPKTNVFLDQSFASFKEAVKNIGEISYKQKMIALGKSPAEGTLKRYALEGLATVISKISTTYASFAIPDYKVSKYLSKNEGKIGFFLTQEKADIPVEEKSEAILFPKVSKKDLKQVEKNVTALAKAGKLKNVTVYAGPGYHGRSLLKIRSSPADYSDEMVKLEKELEHLRKKKKSVQDVVTKIKVLKENLDANQAPQLTALNQMDHFLAKANLSTSIFDLGTAWNPLIESQ